MEKDAEMTKLIFEKKSIENVQDHPSQKTGTEISDCINAGDIVNTTTAEILIDSKLKEDEVYDGAPSANGREETSKSKNKNIANSSDADEDFANPIKRLEHTNNDNDRDEGCQLQRRGTTSKRNDSKSCTSLPETNNLPDCVDGKKNAKPISSHTFHISRVPEKSYSRPTRPRSESASIRNRSRSITFPTNDLVSVLANITIRYQVRYDKV